MPKINTVENSPLRQNFFPDWTKLPSNNVYTLTIDFLPPKVARNKSDVAKITGLSEEFIDEIIKIEKLKNETYFDSSKKRTIGIGHNIDADPNYKLGNKLTDEQAYDLFAKDLKIKQTELKKLTGDARLNKGQKEAMLDLLFNVGYGNLKDTKLIEKIKAGKIDEAVVELDLIYAGGKVNTCLCKRRMENVYDYAKEKPTDLALETLESIKNQGAYVFHKKARSANNHKKKQLLANQSVYLKECNGIISNFKKVAEEKK